MSRGRDFGDSLASVTIGLRRGEAVVGRISFFDPEGIGVDIAIARKGPSGDVGETWTRIATSAVSYVAIHRRSSKEGRPPPAPNQREFDVHVNRHRVFHVSADDAEVDDGLGFWGTPLVQHDFYQEIWFFRASVDRVENAEPLGAMLVREGYIKLDRVENALATQHAERNVRLGEILVEENKVSPGDIERAVQGQGRTERGKPMRLGEFLVQAGLASQADIEHALGEQKRRKGKRLGQILVDLGIVDEVTICKTLARKFHMGYVDLDLTGVREDAVKEIPAQVIRRYSVLPIKSDARTITIAISDPLAIEALDMLRFSTKKQIIEVVATVSQLDACIERLVGKEEETGGVDEILRGMTAGEQGAETPAAAEEDVTRLQSEDSEIAQLVNRIVVEAHRKAASDIHIEPGQDGREVTIRYRVDGQCQAAHQLPGRLKDEIAGRIKVLANLDVTEHRKPQDGKIRFDAGATSIELRVATIPTAGSNEDVVLRLLAKSVVLPLEQLRLAPRSLAAVKGLIAKPYGLVLAVGPTGSGKTTTLHAMLGAINTPERKIWTAEDPIEITQPGLRQVQVNPRIGFTFASALRAFLRADPDVIMVGEMRDLETASIGVESSLTGHLVFSTLHTNNAPETVTRLVDMGLDPFTFADSLLGVVAQRLARALCPACRRPEVASPDEAEEFTDLYGRDALFERLQGTPLVLWRAAGCKKCDGKGLKGRLGIHEVLVADEEIRKVIQRKGNAEQVREVARARGMRTLMEDGLEKCLDGLTDLRQVLAVCSR